MKKFIALAAALLAAFIFFGCSNSVEVKFVDMNWVLAGDYERCLYSAEIHNGLTGGEKISYTDPSLSEMVLTFEKIEGGLARLTMDLTVTYVKHPPFAKSENAAKEKVDYTDCTDTVHSEIIFNGYSQDFNPISVKKTVSLETSKKFDKTAEGLSADKSFSAEFTYPVGKQAGTGKYTDAAGSETALKIKSKSLKNTFDNEQIYYLVSAFLCGTHDEMNEPALGYGKQYKTFNLADHCSYGTGAANYSFAVKDAPRADYYDITADEIAEVTASFTQGQPLNMYYSLTKNVKIGDSQKPVRKFLMLGCEQKTNSDISKTLSVSTYILKDYSPARPAVAAD